jgi:hypothetical protein
MRGESPSLTTIAVGGLAAGQTLHGRYGWTRVVVPEPLSVHVCASAPLETEFRARHAEYREMVLRYRTAEGADEKFHFWVDPRTIKNEFDLIRELANGYHPAHQSPEYDK